jgi:PleD family two-component response regulator
MTDSKAERTRNILLIDSDSAVNATLEGYFAQQNYKLIACATGAEGVSQAVSRPPSLILLSTALPDSSGMDVFNQLRSRSRTAHIPVMFLAEASDIRYQKDFLSAGADDFIPKPVDVDILALRIKNAISRSEREGLNHPRSGLPTGRMIQERVRALADEDNWYKIDFGIDNFNAFREQYGFMTSEEVITFAAGLISDAVRDAGSREDFIGHRDDNEFVIITTPEKGAALRDLLQSRFNDEVLSFYNFMEREQGYMDVPDGAGGTEHKPLMKARIKVQQSEE